jgi:uncharacterized protein YpmB
MSISSSIKILYQQTKRPVREVGRTENQKEKIIHNETGVQHIQRCYLGNSQNMLLFA